MQDDNSRSITCQKSSCKEWIDYFALEITVELYNITTLTRLSDNIKLGFNSIKFLLNCDSIAGEGTRKCSENRILIGERLLQFFYCFRKSWILQRQQILR